MTRLSTWAGLAIIGALLFALGWIYGASAEQAKAKQAERDQLSQAFEQGQALGTVRDRVVTQYVDRVQVIRERGATLIKEVPVYVSAKADAACVVNAGFVRVHDAAAGNLPTPEPSGAADDAPSGIALSAVAATNAGNYATCHETAERLTSLQEYVRGYEKNAKAATDTP